jgi:hypothetical protein
MWLHHWCWQQLQLHLLLLLVSLAHAASTVAANPNVPQKKDHIFVPASTEGEPVRQRLMKSSPNAAKQVGYISAGPLIHCAARKRFYSSYK